MATLSKVGGQLKVVTASLTKHFNLSEIDLDVAPTSDRVEIISGNDRMIIDYNDVTSPVFASAQEMVDQIALWQEQASVGASAIENHKVSEVNSTNIALGANESFVGDFEEVAQYSMLTVQILTDVHGVTKGIELQTSQDGVNATFVKSMTPLIVGNNFGGVFTLVITGKYFRFKYTNNSTAQTSFQVQTIYHKTKNKFLTSTVDQSIAQSTDCEITRVSNDHRIDVNRGLIQGFTYEHVIGRGTSINTAWSFIGFDVTNPPNFLQSAETIRVRAGGNANDSVSGTGARTIRVVGLDENWNATFEDINLNGSSASASTTKTFIRVNRAFVLFSGDYNNPFNVGDILIETTSGTYLTAIENGRGKTIDGVWTIPANCTGYLTRVATTVAKNKLADFELRLREKADVLSAPFGGARSVVNYDEIDDRYEETLESFRRIPEKSDIWAVSRANSGTTTINTTFDIIIVPNF